MNARVDPASLEHAFANSPRQREAKGMNEGSYSGHRLSIDCPHCGARARVRTSRQLTPLVKNTHFQCSNIECGHTFAAQLAITHTIAPSQTPNPDVALPIASSRRPAALACNNDRGRGGPHLAPAALPA